MNSKSRKVAVIVMVTLSVLMAAATTFALSVPAVGSFGYPAYDILVNKGMKGAIGFGLVTVLIALGFYEFKKHPLLGGATLVAAAMIANADSVAVTLGAVVM